MFCFWTVGPTSDDPKIDVDVWIPVLVDFSQHRPPISVGPRCNSSHLSFTPAHVTRGIHAPLEHATWQIANFESLFGVKVWRVETKVDPSPWSLLHVRRGKLFPTQTYGSRPHILAIGHPSYEYHPHFSFIYIYSYHFLIF